MTATTHRGRFRMRESARAIAKPTVTPAAINDANRRRFTRDADPDEGELVATFPKASVSHILGDDEATHVHGANDRLLGTFVGRHEARVEDDGSTGIYFMGEKPNALEPRQPEPTADKNMAGLRQINSRNRQFYRDHGGHSRLCGCTDADLNTGGIVYGSPGEDATSMQARIKAANLANRKHYAGS